MGFPAPAGAFPSREEAPSSISTPQFKDERTPTLTLQCLPSFRLFLSSHSLSCCAGKWIVYLSFTGLSRLPKGDENTDATQVPEQVGQAAHPHREHHQCRTFSSRYTTTASDLTHNRCCLAVVMSWPSRLSIAGVLRITT